MRSAARVFRSHEGAVGITIIIGCLILALAGLLSFNLFYLPKAHAVQDIQGKIRKENEARQLRETVAKQLTEFTEKIKGFPLDPDGSWLSRDFVISARESGLRVLSMLEEDPVPGDGVTYLKINVELRGSFHQVGKLVDKLEHSPSFMWVERMDLQPEGDGSSLKATMILSSLSLDPMGS